MMCNKLWFFLGLVLIFTFTNAELQKDGADIEISESSGDPPGEPLHDNKLGQILAENDSHTKYSGNQNSTIKDTDSKRRKLGKKVTFGNEKALRKNTLYTLPFWDGPAKTKATKKKPKGKKKSRKNIDEEEELHDVHSPSNRKAGKKVSKTYLRGRHVDNHEVGHTRAIWVSNEVQGLDIEEPSKTGSETKKWPKLAPQSNRYKKIRLNNRTTRRHSPLFLMQKPGVPEEETKKKGESQINDLDDKLFYPPLLSPYSIKDEMLSMTEKFTGINISVEVIGRTVEYNDIVLLKASDLNPSSRSKFRADDDKFIDEAPEKKIVFIVHALNVQGMEGVPCLTRPPIFEKLLAFYFAHLDNFDIFLMPMANPDGFAHVKSNSPWSKNRSPQSACPGVNVDRNFDVAWSDVLNVSSCSQVYPGPTPFSEPESRAVRDVLHQYSHKIIAYIHVHAGMDDYNTFKGDAVLYPRGYTDAAVDDDRYVDLRFEIDEMMRNASFQVVTVGMETLHSWYGAVAGTSVDYASEVYGIPYALEFAMQVYDLQNSYNDKPDYSFLALSEIWRRVIDTVLNNIVLKTGTTCVGDGCVH